MAPIVQAPRWQNGSYLGYYDAVVVGKHVADDANTYYLVMWNNGTVVGAFKSEVRATMPIWEQLDAMGECVPVSVRSRYQLLQEFTRRNV